MIAFQRTFDGVYQTLNAVTPVIGGGTLAKLEQLTFYAEYLEGSDAGEIAIETAPHEGYTGTWSEIATLPWTAASKVEHLSLESVFGAVRMRVKTAVTGLGARLSIVGGK